MNDVMAWLRSTGTHWWYDSAVLSAMPGAVGDGCEGVTTNPLLLRRALTGHPQEYRGLVGPAQAGETADDRVVGFMRAVLGRIAERLRPTYEASGGRVGYVCAQVNPHWAGDDAAMLAMAERVHTWAPNIAVKLPATAAGLRVMEACVGLGIPTVITIGFSVAQSLAVGRRYEAALAAHRPDAPAPCFSVLMVGRLNEFLRDVAADHGPAVSEADIGQAGVAVTLRIAELYAERGYTAAVLASGFRAVSQVTALVDRGIHLSIGPEILADLKAAASVPGGTTPDGALERLMAMPEFRQAYDEDGLAEGGFIGFGPVQRTLAQFEFDGWQGIASHLDESPQ